MATTVEKIYLGRDNTIDLLLKADGVAADLSEVTQIDCRIGDQVVESLNAAEDPIRWNQSGYATGEIRLSMGDVELEASTAQQLAYIVVYDATYADGLVWGYFPVRILDV